MKRIYLLVALFMAFAGTVSAQKDLAVWNNLNNPQVFKYNNPVKTIYLVQFSFKNTSTTPFTTADTIILKSSGYSGNLKLSLPAAGIAAMDTVYYTDTFYWTAPPTGTQWCDSVWFTTNGVVQTEPIVTDNKSCKPVSFVQDPLSVNDLAADENGFVVYPNPASSVLNLQYNFDNTDANVVIRDLIGKVVYQQSLGKVSGVQQIAIDISSLAGGMYMVELSTKDAKVVDKITVQK